MDRGKSRIHLVQHFNFRLLLRPLLLRKLSSNLFQRRPSKRAGVLFSVPPLNFATSLIMLLCRLHQNLGESPARIIQLSRGKIRPPTKSLVSIL